MGITIISDARSWSLGSEYVLRCVGQLGVVLDSSCVVLSFVLGSVDFI